LEWCSHDIRPMYRFQIDCHTHWGEEVCIVGASASLGRWDVNKAVPLKPEHYPLWKSSVIDIDDGVPETDRVEYKYLKRSAQGVQWEQGNNRWVPKESSIRLTVHDSTFGRIQPEPFSFREDIDDRDVPEDGGQARCRVVVLGSSVAEGYNAWRKRGWAYLLKRALADSFGHEVINVSMSGANTASTKARFIQVVEPLKPDMVIVGLSLGNEGLAHCPPAERRAAQHRFEQGLLDLIRMVVAINAVPVLGGVYANNDFNADTYAMLKETSKTMSTWGVPVLEWLAAVDDGRGHWREGLYFDHAHPNSEGHRRMFECIDLRLFDDRGVDDLPPMIRRRSSLSLFDTVERKTSHSSLDRLVQESQREEQYAHSVALGSPVFDDGQGFSVTVCRGAISVRNKTPFAYTISPEWGKLCHALAAGGLHPGTYVCKDTCQADDRTVFLDASCWLANKVVVPPGADSLFTAAFPPGVGKDR